MCNVSPATGFAQTDVFGYLESYDKVLITDDMDCPIDENTVLFIDKEPQVVDGKPMYDYTVKRVAKSLNSISYAVSILPNVRTVQNQGKTMRLIASPVVLSAEKSTSLRV